MKTTNAQRKINIIKNIEYLMRTRGETKASFSNRTGLTRTTIYKILDGRVNNVQQATINRISDFFGVSCEEIEDYDLAKLELLNETLSTEGNKNPSAVPVIPQSRFLAVAGWKVGQLVTEFPLTYFFGDESNMVAMKIETEIKGSFIPGEVIIIKRPPVLVCDSPLLYHSGKNGFFVVNDKEDYCMEKNHQDTVQFLGYIFGERL
ncbi:MULTISPECIES: helix-turn-helix domain-containing protein [Serratia]|jgi:DNA-binding Xre family transcriptional regulator|uniref:XRE family transcriptional regulator n=1 Tax=Serratia liquefaciens TaxID=614 RepID=A0A515D4H1_SERLI|nr:MULTISPECIES: helix-turn-helix transcriptional regulator [Serratia]AMH00511.1 XRE family transcriptional regulator [Serratia liquefaciens]MBI6163046.1 helix-turn-helix transcriptional regulator [Serratia liquefaciens]MBV0843380.1 helix-turn-helix transcriptional regulator [Serratia liquefaciens]OKP17147.1 transcriptional regulator [Serratia liquefaciens]PVD40047.1 XRE family transcriptional regulator [Serratia liquefaciens]